MTNDLDDAAADMVRSSRSTRRPERIADARDCVDNDDVDGNDEVASVGGTVGVCDEEKADGATEGEVVDAIVVGGGEEHHDGS